MISIIVPFFNSQDYIDKCIESVQKQTFKDWELILINDGSTDNSVDIVGKYLQKDHRIRLINQYNSGVSEARNRGIDESKGKYIFFLDSDDYIDGSTLENLYNYAQKTNGDIIIGQRVRINLDNIELKKIKIKSFDQRQAIRRFLNFRLISGYVTGKLYKSSLIKNYHFDKNVNYGEDGIFSFNILLEAKKVVYCNFPSYEYRIRVDSLTGRNKDYGEKNLDIFKQVKNVNRKLRYHKLWAKIFEFELFRQEICIYNGSSKRAQEKYINEFKVMKKFCNKYWIWVVLFSMNPRIKYYALKYRINKG